MHTSVRGGGEQDSTFTRYGWEDMWWRGYVVDDFSFERGEGGNTMKSLPICEFAIREAGTAISRHGIFMVENSFLSRCFSGYDKQGIFL